MKNIVGRRSDCKLLGLFSRFIFYTGKQHSYLCFARKITPKAKKKRIITKGSQTENNCQTLLGDSNRFTHMIGVEWKCKRGLGFVGLGLVMNLQPLLGD